MFLPSWMFLSKIWPMIGRLNTIIFGEFLLKFLDFFDVFEFSIDDFIHIFLYSILKVFIEFLEGNLAVAVGVDSVHNLVIFVGIPFSIWLQLVGLPHFQLDP